MQALLGSQLGVGKNLFRWFKLCILSTLVSLGLLPTGAVRGLHVGAGRYSGSREALKGPRSCLCPLPPPGSHPGFPPAELSAVTRRPPGWKPLAAVIRELGSRLPVLPLSPWPAELPRFPRKGVFHGARPQRAPPPPGLPGLGLDGWETGNQGPESSKLH